MGGIKIEGLDKLQKALKKNATLYQAKRVVRKNGSELEEKMMVNADFKMGYQTGTTKRSIKLNISDGGMTAIVDPDPRREGAETDYSSYIEYGTRFMDAQPFVRPALDVQKEKFNSDMQKLVR